MTIATLKDVLAPAMAGHYALAGLVVLGWEDAKAYVDAAEEAGCAVILQVGPACRKHTPVAILGKMLRYLADQASVPVVCHIDHAHTLEECLEGIDHAAVGDDEDVIARDLGPDTSEALVHAPQ